MYQSNIRSLKCRQIGMVVMQVSIDGTVVTPVAAGVDSAFVDSITDNGAGDYTITLKEAAQQSLTPIGAFSVTSNITVEIFAVTTSSIRVRCRNAAGVLTDASIGISFLYANQLSYNL